MGRKVKIPWVGGSIYTMVRGVRYTMDMGINIPWVGGQNTMDKGFDIPWVEVVKIPWVKGSIYHG